jgi:hypothetical protein
VLFLIFGMEKATLAARPFFLSSVSSIDVGRNSYAMRLCWFGAGFRWLGLDRFWGFSLSLSLSLSL